MFSKKELRAIKYCIHRTLHDVNLPELKDLVRKIDSMDLYSHQHKEGELSPSDIKLPTPNLNNLSMDEIIVLVRQGIISVEEVEESGVANRFFTDGLLNWIKLYKESKEEETVCITEKPTI